FFPWMRGYQGMLPAAWLLTTHETSSATSSRMPDRSPRPNAAYMRCTASMFFCSDMVLLLGHAASPSLLAVRGDQHAEARGEGEDLRVGDRNGEGRGAFFGGRRMRREAMDSRERAGDRFARRLAIAAGFERL